MLRWTATARTAQSGVYQYAPQRGPADVDALALSKQFAQVGVVGSEVAGAGKAQHLGPGCLGCGVGRPATTMAVSEYGGSSPPVCRQDAPGMARAHSHQLGCLARGHLLRQQTVQDLESRLFFLVQRHILHKGTVTFMLTS